MSIYELVHHPKRPFILRFICCLLCLFITYSACAVVINSLTLQVQIFKNEQARKVRGFYSDKPGKPFLGENPGRDPVGRGGIWTENLLKDRENVRHQERLRAPKSLFELHASTNPDIRAIISQSPPGGGGGSEGGEGNGPGGGSPGSSTGGSSGGSSGSTGGAGGTGSGTLNTHTGNRSVSYSLIGWSERGDQSVYFELFHNSMGDYSFDLGKGWSHNYDVKVNHTAGSSAIIRWGNGKETPFSEVYGEFIAPDGCFDSLAHLSSGEWELTTSSQTVFSFDSDGYLINITDKNSNQTVITRDTSHKPIAITGPSGRSLFLNYSNGLITGVTSPDGRIWTLVYDGLNQLVEICYPLLNGQSYSRLFTYNSHFDIVSEQDLRGNIWTFTYDAKERLTSFTNPLSQTFTYAYNSASVEFGQPDGTTVVHHYSAGKIASAVDEAGFSESYVYDGDRNVITLTDKRGYVWYATYDGHGNQLTTTNPLGGSTSRTFSSKNELLTSSDELGNTSVFTYDSQGNLLTATDPLGRATARFSYNSFGEVQTVTDAEGRVSSQMKNSQGDLVQVVDASGVQKSVTTSILGKTTLISLSTGHSISANYDDWNRPISIIDSITGTTDIEYDAESQIISITNQLGKTTTRTLDALGRIVSATNSLGETSTNSYDVMGRLVSKTNAKGNTTTIAYTPRGEMSSQILPDGAIDMWVYDADGNVVNHTNPLGQTIVFAYDELGQNILIDYPSGQTDTQYFYDSAGRLTSMIDGSGTSSWVYDSANQLQTLSTPQGDVSYTYNLAGQSLQTTNTGVGTTSVSYDSAGRPTVITDAFGDVSTYGYDSVGRISVVNHPNGTFEEYSYDSLNRITAVDTKDNQGVMIKSREYSYDQLSRIIQMVEDSDITTYIYDDIGQLLSEIKSSEFSAAYIYDANGNRTSRTINGIAEGYTYDVGDKLLAVTGGSDPRTFAYDAAGRTTSITRQSGVTSFTYNFDSQVTSISQPQSITNTFAYNGAGARVSLTSSSGGKIFKRSGVTPLDGLLSDGSAIYTPYGENRNGVKKVYHGGIKSNDALSDIDGLVTSTKIFDAFGNENSSSGGWDSPFGYGGLFGYQSDNETGYRLLGYRYYDPETGRFLTRDPLQDGRNWYVYCGNDPVNAADPSGLILETVLDIAGALFDAYEVYKDPTDWKKWGMLAWSITSIVVPGVPGSYVGRLGMKVINHSDEATDIGKGIAKGFGSCFAAGTKILMSDGSAKNIEDIEVGDVVLTRSEREPDISLLSTGLVKQKFIHKKDQTLLLKFDNGSTIETTSEHPFYVSQIGFVPAHELQVGNSIVEDDLETSEIVSIVRLDSPEVVYNFEVTGTHTYFVQSGADYLWVHNKCSNPWGRKGAPDHQKAIQDIIDTINSEGGIVVAGGEIGEKMHRKVRRYPDVIAKNADGKTVLYQVGRTTKSGKPVSREIDAAGELAEYDEVFFIGLP